MEPVKEKDPSLSWYRKFFDEAGVGMAITDKTYRFIKVNEAFCKFLGYTEAELLTKTILDVTHPDDLAKSSEKLAKQFSGSISGFNMEKRYLTKAGEVVWGAVTSSNSVNLPGSDEVINFAVIEDISKRKRLEESLKESEASYKGLFDSVAEAIYIQDRDGKFLDVNPGAEKMYGYPREWFIGKSPLDVSAPGKNDLAKIKEEVDRAFAGEPQEFEFWGVRKTGEAFPKDVRLYKGQYFGKEVVIALAIDITDRKRVEEELTKASKDVEEALRATTNEKAKLETVLNGIADGVFVVDDHGKITLFNQAAERITGFSFATVKDKQYWEVLNFVPEGLSEAKADFVRGALAGREQELEVNLTFRKASGKMIPIQASAAALDGRGRPSLGIVVIFRDVSKEREIQQLRDEFMMIASHELRAPMTAVKWLVSMMLEGSYGAIEENLKSPLGTIATATNRLIHLVNDMINITRIESGNLRLALSDFDIKKMIDDLLITFGPEAQKKNIAIEASGVTSVVVQADSDWTAQILSNLIDNAIKFSREGDRITISTAKEGEFLNVLVADTGIGIPDDFKEKLFTKFAQVINKKAGKPIGTGLGLFISRELARGMGGGLELAETNIDIGSTFVIKIPLSGSPAAAAALANQKKNPG